MKTETFIKLIENKHLQVKLKLREYNRVLVFGNMLVETYDGREDFIWCDLEPINNINSLSYKVFCKPAKDNYKGREFYTMDMVNLINRKLIDIRVLYDEFYNDKLRVG